MKLLDLTLQSPSENLACDEALLDAAENGDGGEVLRFWEAREHFVVVGYANKVRTEVNVAACEVRGIPIHRRCSGGGTVLQGPGCLNYALVLKISGDGSLKNISSANQFIMERNRAAIEALLSRSSRREEALSSKSEIGNRKFEIDQSLLTSAATSRIEVCGHTDLAIDGRKFSGNSQRRRKHYLLFHGTFLLNFNLALVNELMPMPTKEPSYREGRSHVDFLTNLNIVTDFVKAALAKAWDATGINEKIPTEQISKLVTEKYSNRNWNFKF